MDSLYSTSWYRVAALRPRLARAARFTRHHYRGELWYVVRDPESGRVHRLTPAVHGLAVALDGQVSIDRAWQAVVVRFGDDAPTQDEAIAALGLLYGASLLRGDVPADTEALFRRDDERTRKERRGRLNPIAFRVPLCDPNAFLTRWRPLAQAVFSLTGALSWCAVVLAAGIAALRHGPELVAASRSLTEPESLLAFWLAYPVVKALHELGHAFAVKRWGGEVHEIGILFLVFMPVPYVDASAASVFPEKHRRMLVGAAGIGVELLLAALALFVWLSVEPGFVRHIAYAVIVVGGISTLLFNGNPLLRFDGYHVLADAIEIPNLGTRANQYLSALAKRQLLGLRDTPLPETAPGEPGWLVGYAIASSLYGTSVMLGIALYLATNFFALGVALALFTLYTRIGHPLLKLVAFVTSDPAAGERRGRVLVGSLSTTALIALVLFALPLPLHTRSEGVTWLPEQAHVRAGADGFVVEMLVDAHAAVRAGDPLFRTRNPAQVEKVVSLRAERDALRLRLDALTQGDRVRAAIARDRLADAEAALARARQQESESLVRSGTDGIFVPRDGHTLLGRYVKQGEGLAYVVDLSTATARVVVSQDDVGLLRERTRGASVRLAHEISRVLPAQITREVPAAGDRLPTAALGTTAGGPFAVDPADPDGLRTLTSVFQFDLALPPGSILAAGERVHVRFDHGVEPLGPRGWRAVRRHLLRHLGV